MKTASLLSRDIRSPFLFREVRRQQLPIGVYRDRMHKLASAINCEIGRNPNRHIFQLLESVRGTLLPATEEDHAMVDSMVDLKRTFESPDEATKIPFDNFAYQALVWAVRSWPKRDIHCHVGTSLSTDYLFERIRGVATDTEREKAIRKKLEFDLSPAAEKKLDQGKLGHKLREFLLAKTDWGQITLADVEKIFRSYSGNRNDATQVLDMDLDDFATSVKYAVEQYLEDGVVEIYLGFVPLRENKTVSPPSELEGYPYISIESTLQKIDETLIKMEDMAEERFGIRPRVFFTFDFDRSNGRQTPAEVLKAVRELCRLKEQERGFAWRMYGIDIAGTENPLRKKGTEAPENGEFMGSIQLAINSGFQFATHLGDPNQADQRYVENPPNPDDHLAYFERAVVAMRDFRGWHIGHAKIIADGGVRKKTSFIPFSPPQQEQVERLVEIMKGNQIALQSCPPGTPSTPTISAFRRHHIFYWMREGIQDISLGVDGVYYGNGRSLSQWVANLLLAAPEDITVSRIKKMVDGGLAEASEFWATIS